MNHLRMPFRSPDLKAAGDGEPLSLVVYGVSSIAESEYYLHRSFIHTSTLLSMHTFLESGESNHQTRHATFFFPPPLLSLSHEAATAVLGLPNHGSVGHSCCGRFLEV